MSISVAATNVPTVLICGSCSTSPDWFVLITFALVVEAPDAKVKFFTKLSEDNPVKFAPDIAGNAPVIFAAGKLVKFAPDAAGKVAGNLASGIVPEVRLAALKFVKSTVSKLKPPLPFVFKNCPLVPSSGRV